jgi:hypothetical protein
VAEQGVCRVKAGLTLSMDEGFQACTGLFQGLVCSTTPHSAITVSVPGVDNM